MGEPIFGRNGRYVLLVAGILIEAKVLSLPTTYIGGTECRVIADNGFQAACLNPMLFYIIVIVGGIMILRAVMDIFGPKNISPTSSLGREIEVSPAGQEPSPANGDQNHNIDESEIETKSAAYKMGRFISRLVTRR